MAKVAAAKLPSTRPICDADSPMLVAVNGNQKLLQVPGHRNHSADDQHVAHRREAQQVERVARLDVVAACGCGAGNSARCKSKISDAHDHQRKDQRECDAMADAVDQKSARHRRDQTRRRKPERQHRERGRSAARLGHGADQILHRHLHVHEAGAEQRAGDEQRRDVGSGVGKRRRKQPLRPSSSPCPTAADGTVRPDRASGLRVPQVARAPAHIAPAARRR